MCEKHERYEEMVFLLGKFSYCVPVNALYERKREYQTVHNYVQTLYQVMWCTFDKTL